MKVGRLAVSIIILAKNEEKNLRRLLPRLREQKFPGKKEILVVDSGSTDDSLNYLKSQLVKVLQIPPEKFGHGKTRNFAAQRAKGEILVFISPDALPKNKNWLENLIKPLEKSKTAGVFGRQVAWVEAAAEVKFFYQEVYPAKGRILAQKDAFEFSFNHLLFSNVNSAIKKSVWEKINFANRAFMSEDQLWAHKVLKQGWQIIYEPEAAVYHSHDYSLLYLVKRHAASGYSLKEIPTASWLTLFCRGISFLVKEIKFLIKKKYYFATLRVVLREFIRAISWTLGREAGVLPEDLRKKLLFPARSGLKK